MSEYNEYIIGEAKDWLELQRGEFGEVPPAFQPVIDVVEVADQQAARIAELEAEVARLNEIEKNATDAISYWRDVSPKSYDEQIRMMIDILGYDPDPEFADRTQED